MSNYLTLVEFKSRVDADDISQVLKDIDEADRDEYLQNLIDEVEETIEWYCSGRYSTPLNATPKVISITWRLTYIELCRRKHWNVDDSMEDEAERIIDLLERVQARKAHMKDQTSKASAENLTDIRSTNPPARTTGNKRVFDRNSGLKYF